LEYNYNVLVEKCRGNSICIIEYFKNLLDKGVEFTPEDVKNISNLLGEPTKKIDVFRDKYVHVYLKYIQENCSVIDDQRICIYSWKPGVPVRYFPVSLDATGTILYFHGDEIEVLAYPTCRTYDIGGHDVSIPDPGVNPVIEVTERIDGYQVTFYYNPVIKRWIPATRYVLHNMVYIGKRLEISGIEEIVNPYVLVADKLAEEYGLYDQLKGFEGWTFTFILEPPEPAITKPNIELFDYSRFKLYLLNARKPNGELLTVRESRELIKWISVPVLDVSINDKNTFAKYIEMWRMDLFKRSRFVRFDIDKPFRPYTLEIPSTLYSEAMNVKYSSNPKSLIILASHGYRVEAVELLVDYGDIRSAGREIIEYYEKISGLIPSVIDRDELYNLLAKYNILRDLKGDLEKARRTGEIERFTRKLACLLAGDYIYNGREMLKNFYMDLSKIVETKGQTE